MAEKRGVAGHVNFCNPNTLTCAHTFLEPITSLSHILCTARIWFLMYMTIIAEDFSGLWILLAFYILLHTGDSSRLTAPLGPDNSSPVMAWHNKPNFASNVREILFIFGKRVGQDIEDHFDSTVTAMGAIGMGSKWEAGYITRTIQHII